MKLSEELIELISMSQAKDVFCNFAEVVLDSSLEDGILRDVPIVRTILKTGNSMMTIKDRIFVRKVGVFLRSLEDIPYEKCEKFLRDKLGHENERRIAGEKLIILIDKQDDLAKTGLMGYVFKSYIEGDISQDDFYLLCHSISNAHMSDLEGLECFTKGLCLGDHVIGSALIAINLAEMKVSVFDATDGGTATAQIDFELSRLGIALAWIMVDYKSKSQAWFK